MANRVAYAYQCLADNESRSDRDTDVVGPVLAFEAVGQLAPERAE